jgi:hypothetical protein
MKLRDMMLEENTGMRFRTGSGKPGLNVVLGGTVQGEGVTDTFSTGGGAFGATAKLARGHKDVRLAQIASGQSGGGSTWGGGDDGGGGTGVPGIPQDPR